MLALRILEKNIEKINIFKISNIFINFRGKYGKIYENKKKI